MNSNELNYFFNSGVQTPQISIVPVYEMYVMGYDRVKSQPRRGPMGRLFSGLIFCDMPTDILWVVNVILSVFNLG